jgi:hypothetical protein
VDCGWSICQQLARAAGKSVPTWSIWEMILF